jgi:hypothetical protein
MSNVLKDLFSSKFFDFHPSADEEILALTNLPPAKMVEMLEAQRAVQKQLDSVSGMAAIQATPGGAPNRNYEAAIFSRLAVSGVPHQFDLVKVHRSRDGSKYFVFVVIENRWSVIEDGAMFPSDELITSLRCLQF